MVFRKTVLSIVFALLACTAAYAYDAKLLSEIPVNGKISALALNPATDTAVVTSETGKSLAVIDTVSHAVTFEIPLPAAPSGVAVHKGLNRAIVASEEGKLFSYDLKSGAPAGTVDVGIAILVVAVDETTNSAFLGVDGGIRIVDLANGKVVTSVNFAGKSVRISMGKTFAVVVSREETGAVLRLVNMATGSIEKMTSLAGDVVSLAIDESLGYILVTQTDKPGLLLLDATTLRPAGVIPTDKQAEIVVVNPSTHTAVLANTLDGSLSIVDLERKTVIATLQLFEEIGTVGIDTARNRALVAHGASLAVIQLENPVPAINGLVPLEGAAGENDLSLSVYGEKFLKDSQTLFKGCCMSTYFATNEHLRVAIPPERLAYPGDVAVSVTNPPPGGGISNELTFKVLAPVPQLAAILPATAVVAAPFTLRVEGKNFLPSAVINLGARKLTTKYVSSIVLEAPVYSSLVAEKGSFPVSVTNSGQTTFTSNSLALQVLTAEDAAALAAKNSAAQTAAGQGFGSLGGRILNTEMHPLKGVTVSAKGISARTDAYGNFTLENLQAGKRTILIDGSTAEETNGHYPTIPISVDIEAGRHNLMPFTPYFHRQKSRNFVNISPAKDTILTDPEVPGFEMRIPAGVNITGWDGKVNLKVSVRSVPTDRLPVRPLPPNSFARTVYMFYFNKVGGGKPDRPIPVKAPNDLGLLPGEKAVLWYYDESPNEGEAPNDWAIAGTGTVTPDGRFIVSDPGVGIPKFCCGAATYGGSGAGSPPNGPCGSCCSGDSGNNNAGDPVNLATGYFIHEKTDYKVNGIIPVEIKRFYRSGDNGYGAFGKGTYFGYDWWLGVYTDMLLLLKPGNYQYRFYKQPDGTFINTTDPEYRGDVFYYNGDNTYTLKRKDGWSYKLGTDRLLDRITDPNGNALTFLKQIDGNISTIILPDGRQINIGYLIGGRDNITSITGPLGTVTYSYYNTGTTGKLQSVQYPDGSSISYTYDTSGRMATVTENGKLVVTNVYDANNRVTNQTHPDGGAYTFNYTLAGGNLTETAMTGPNGATTTSRFYDDSGAYHNGYIAKTTTPDGATVYEMEAGTNLIRSVTDPLLRRTSYTYDTKGRRLTMTDPIGNTTGYQYEDACSNVTKITDPLGKSTTYSYTFAPSTCRKTRTEIRDPLQNLTVVEYDNYGKPTTISDPNGNATTFNYDPAHPEQLSSVADPLGNTVRYTYDTFGRLATATDAKGAKTTYGYDGVSERLASVTDPHGKTTGYAYDPSGNLSTVTDSKMNTIWYEYDDRNRVTKMTDQLGRYETYSYYRNAEITPTTGDNLKSYMDRKGQTTTFNQYDPMNRLKKVTYNDGSTLDYLYDAAGRATGISDSISGTLGYTYETLGCPSCSGVDRISQETTPLGTINYAYNPAGKRASMTVAGEPVVTYTYDDAGRLTDITRNVGGTPRTYTLGYDGAGRRASVQIPLANGSDSVTTIYGYDIANRLTSMLLQGASATIENLTYTIDPNGNRLSFRRNAAQTISPAVTSTNHDAANEMLAYNNKNLSYDANGNLQTRTDICGTTTFTWDARNRLTGISGFKPDCTALAASFSYDALNRRSSKTINGTTTQFVYDGWDIVQEITGEVNINYVRTLNIDEPLTRLTGPTIRHYVKDALGSVLALTDDTGATMTTYVYDAFGNVTTAGEASDNPFQYTSRENDETGLYYYRARYFSPEMQRFISEDPIRLRGGINYYSYVQNNPINWFDPEGLAGRGRFVRPRESNYNNSRAKKTLDDLGEIPDFNMGDPDCVYRPINKCVKINCNKDVDSSCPGPWFVKDVSTDCWCEEWKTVLECR